MNVLGVENKIYKNCDHCRTRCDELIIPYDIWCDWRTLMEQNRNREWGGHFKVDLDPTCVSGRITEFAIPEQRVNSVACEFDVREHTDGFVHSHHSMSLTGHSSVDDASFRNMVEWSIVLTHTSVEATRKINTPCGGVFHVDVDIVIDYPDYMIAMMENIKDKETTVVSTKGYNMKNGAWNDKTQKWVEWDTNTDPPAWVDSYWDGNQGKRVPNPKYDKNAPKEEPSKVIELLSPDKGNKKVTEIDFDQRLDEYIKKECRECQKKAEKDKRLIIDCDNCTILSSISAHYFGYMD